MAEHDEKTTDRKALAGEHRAEMSPTSPGPSQASPPGQEEKASDSLAFQMIGKNEAASHRMEFGADMVSVFLDDESNIVSVAWKHTPFVTKAALESFMEEHGVFPFSLDLEKAETIVIRERGDILLAKDSVGALDEAGKIHVIPYRSILAVTLPPLTKPLRWLAGRVAPARVSPAGQSVSAEGQPVQPPAPQN